MKGNKTKTLEEKGAVWAGVRVVTSLEEVESTAKQAK
jgi:hypothetical protein